jgi:hypothetical protein
VLSVRDARRSKCWAVRAVGQRQDLAARSDRRHPHAGRRRDSHRRSRRCFRRERIDLPARDRRIGYVPQDALLFPNSNVTRNINLAPGEGDFESLVEILDLQDCSSVACTNLSGGEAARRDRARVDDAAVDPAAR